MSRGILTYKAVKMNTLLTNASVENFDRHQKIQCFDLSITCKTRDYEYNCTMFLHINFSIPWERWGQAWLWFLYTSRESSHLIMSIETKYFDSLRQGDVKQILHMHPSSLQVLFRSYLTLEKLRKRRHFFRRRWSILTNESALVRQFLGKVC